MPLNWDRLKETVDGEKLQKEQGMWHVETDVFALAVFLIMFIKEFGLRKIRKQRQREGIAERNVQSDAFYFVLVFSIISVIIDITSSVAMNRSEERRVGKECRL